MAHTYKVGDFAELTGVTARALHHYERLGLLNPARTDAGYRVYSESDLATLEQIVTLKFLGFRLEQIKSLLRSDPEHLAEVFAAQRWLLEERARRIAVAIHALEDAERSGREETRPDTSSLPRIIEVLDMKNHVTDAAQYAALLDRKVERLRAMTPEARAEMQREWIALVQDIESALDEDPASQRAQSLAARWLNLLAALNGGAPVDPALAKAAATQRQSADWPGGSPAGSAAVWDVVGKALAAR